MKLLLTGAWRDARASIGELERFGHDVCFLQNENEPLPCQYEWIEGAVCNGLFLYHPIERFTNLRYIQLTSAGFDRVSMEYITKHNIKLHNARGVYSTPMAEFAVCGVLSLYKQLSFFWENQKEHRWEKRRNLRELTGKTVCIIGCGSVGTECAKKFAAFGCNVNGVDIKPYDNDSFFEILPFDRLDYVLEKANIVILTIPLTEQTYHLIDEEKLTLMKPDTVLVNISRGAVVDTEGLIKMLQSQPTFGAVLDVFEQEPLSPDSPLWYMENVILTPHNSFVGQGNGERLSDLILGQLRKEQ